MFTKIKTVKGRKVVRISATSGKRLQSKKIRAGIERNKKLGLVRMPTSVTGESWQQFLSRPPPWGETTTTREYRRDALRAVKREKRLNQKHPGKRTDQYRLH
ncbi:MAG: hypothetical protein WC308_00925 [archaeon]|jgi:hypothetical protein